MNRSQFLHRAFLLPFLQPFFYKQPGSKPVIMTVAGPVAPQSLGWALPHEHMLVDFIGADKASPERYNRQAVFERMLPFVQAAKKAGAQAIFDCTPQYLGRDVRLLQQLAAATGAHFVTNTGYYSAVHNKYLPQHAFRETAAQLAARWVKEWEEGIDGSGIRPGFIKISVDTDPLTDMNIKIVQAAALAHLATGLTIASHTGSGKAALAQLDILAAEGVAANAFVWVHAQNEKNRDLHRAAGKRGAWISFDGFGWGPASEYIAHLKAAQGEGLLQQVLVSHDAGWYGVGEKDGGEIKPFTPVFTQLIPALKGEGFKEAWIEQIFLKNPAAAFSVQVRHLKK